MADNWDEPVLPHEPARRGRSGGDSDRGMLLAIIGLCAVAGIVIFSCLGLIVWSLIRPWDVPVAEQETPEQKRAALQAAFGAADAGVPADRLAEIDGLFVELEAVIDDDSAFRRFVDRERLLEAMKASGHYPVSMRLWEGMLGETTLSGVWTPWYFTRHRIAHVEDLAGGREALVYGYFWDSAGDMVELRWWLVRRNGGWKFYDWELLQVGQRESVELALWQAGLTDQYYAVFEELADAYEGFMSGDEDVARKRMQRAEALLPQVPDSMRDNATLWTALYWTYGSDYEAAVRVAAQVKSSDMPGVHYIQILRHNELGEYEELLESCRALEAAIGPTPNAARFRVTALTELGRLPEAAAACRECLRMDPEDQWTLQRYTLSLRPESKRELLDLISAARDPAETAVSLATALVQTGDVWALDELAAAAGAEVTEGPGAPKTVARWAMSPDQVAAIVSSRAELQGDWPLAAEQLFDAWDAAAEVEQKDSWFWRYLDMMSRMDKVVEGYRAFPPAQAHEAFAYLANGYEDGESSYLEPEVLRSLLDAHQPLGENDLWWHFHSGDLATAEGDATAAVGHYQRGIAIARKTNSEYGDYEWAFTDRLAKALLDGSEEDEWWAFYLEGDDRDGRFATLASLLRERERWEDLGRLIERHRALSPDDVMSDYYAGVIELEHGRFAAAEALLQSGRKRLAAAEDGDWREWQFRQLQVEARIKEGKALSAYDDIAPRPETFVQLATYFAGEGDVETAVELSARMRQDEPEAPAGWTWPAQLLFQQEDYAAVIDLLSDQPWQGAESSAEYQWSECRRYYFRSLLRLERIEEAVRFAAEEVVNGDRTNLIIAHALAGDHERVASLLDAEEEYRLSGIYTDEDAGPILYGEEYRDVREAAPPPLPYVAATSWIGLLQAPVPHAPDDVRSLAVAALGEDVQLEPVSEPGSTQTAYMLTSGPHRLLLAFGDDQYVAPSSTAAAAITDAALRKVVESHSGWFSISALGSADSAQIPRVLRRLAQELAGESLQALYDWNQDLLVPAGSELDRALADEAGGQADWGPSAVYASLWREVAQPGAAAQRQWLQTRLRTIGHQVYHDQLPCEVTLQISGGNVQERLVAVLERVEPREYGGWEFIARLSESSNLIPFLKTGEPVRIQDYEVIDWRVTIDGVEHHGQTEAAAWWAALQQK